MSADPHAGPVRIVGRYAIYDAIASGGMATVHLGRLLGPERFTRTVAIKRLHEAFVADPDFVAMFIDEARLAARVRHPNVLQTLDLLVEQGEILLVVEYVQGRTLAQLIELAAAQRIRIPHRMIASIMSGVLQGLHAAHEARDEYGRPLGLVHRDVSPQNVMIGFDGVARVLDFGVAKAEGRTQMTREGQVKGKLGYIAPEQIDNVRVTPATDVYSAAVVTWEALTGQRLFEGDTPAATVARMLQAKITPPSELVPELPKAYDAVLLRALARDPAKRYASAREMALALEACDGAESALVVGAWLERLNRGDRGEAAKRDAHARAISGVQKLESPSVDEEFDWSDLVVEEQLETIDDMETIPGETLTTQMPKARQQVLQVLAQREAEKSPPPAPPREPPSPALPREPVSTPLPPPKRSRWLRTLLVFAILASAAVAAAYTLRGELLNLPFAPLLAPTAAPSAAPSGASSASVDGGVPARAR